MTSFIASTHPGFLPREALDNVVPLRHTDADVAADLRARLAPLLDQVTGVMNEARLAGLNLTFNIALDGYGRHAASPIMVVKLL